MAVEAFIQPTDVKITVEKEVKQKPTIEELTTIEKPGRPVPQELEPNEPKLEKRKKTKPKAEARKEPIKRDATLIITEKPQAAEKIARAIGSPRQYKENGASYFELEHNNQKILVASAVGHLFNLTYAQGQKGWPIYETTWIPSYEKKAAAFTKKYITLLTQLAKRATEVIIATDFDIEGEVIGWNVLRFICKKETAKRMKFSTLTEEELKNAFNNPLPEPAWGNAYAGETRHIVDWLYGINLSRALMAAIKKTGSFKILSIGRVQGPALKIIVDREREIIAFKAVPFWRVHAHSNNIRFTHPNDIFDKTQLEKFKDIKEGIAETDIKQVTLQPAHPFDLTTLQREAYRLLRLSPSETLRTAQKLYLAGVISYPRTSSQKIPKEIKPKAILKKLEKRFPQAKTTTREIPVEGKKADPAHPSIFPTGEYSSLNETEEKLYQLIVKRFISCFSADARTENKKIILTANNLPFIASGLKVLEPGWTAIYPHQFEEIDIPTLTGKQRIDKIEIEDRETQPPSRYTPTSLITLLEKKNLGTKATRSSIVDILFDRGYLEGTSIKATPLGIQLITTLEKHSPIIIDESLTASLEEQMEHIESATSNFQEEEKKIIDKVKETLTKIAEQFKPQEEIIGKELLSSIQEQRKEEQESAKIMPCPVCKTGTLRIIFSPKTRRSFVGCSNYPACKQTHTLPPNALIKTTDKKNEQGLPILMAIRKGRKPWLFPFDPHWRENHPQQPKAESIPPEKE